MAMAETQVAIPGGTAALSSLVVGQPVLGGSVGGGGVVWSPQRVAFHGSSGSDGPQPDMIYVHVNGSEYPLVVTSDLPFLLADGTLKRAMFLQIADRLVSQSGTPVAIEALMVGAHVGQVYNIAIGSLEPIQPGQSFDNHLIAIAGIVVGDMVLQVSSIPTANGPAIGTPAYSNLHPGGFHGDVERDAGEEVLGQAAPQPTVKPLPQPAPKPQSIWARIRGFLRRLLGG